MLIECKTRSPLETRALGQRIGAHLPRPALILLDGEMGAGKTLLTKGLYLGAGGNDPDGVTSPTYNLVHVYDDVTPPFVHADLFRLERDDQWESLDPETTLISYGGIVVVEWPKIAGDGMDRATALTIELSRLDDDARRIVLSASDVRYARIFEILAA